MTRPHRGAFALLWLMLLAAAASATPQIRVGPYLQHVTQTSITIMWETTEAADSRVDYGPTPAYGKSAVSAEPVTIHEVTITGLEPETRCHYRVTSGGASSADATFETAVRRETPFRFVVYGDSRSDPAAHRRVCEGIAGAKPRIAINVGDVVANGEVYAQWKTEFLDPAAAFARTTPLYVAIGNHEKNAHWYYDYLSYPKPENYYAFTYGNARFVIVDTNQDYEPGSAQHEWLVKELASDAAQNATWLFAFFHHPPYTEGWDSPGYGGEIGARKHLMPLMERYGVDMVFNGHTHDYERGYMNGVHWIISGGGGAALDHWVRGFEHIAVSRFAHHYCTVDIAGRELTLRAVTPEGEVLDSITIRKRPVPKP